MQKSNVWLATTLLNDRVCNSAGDNLGKIEDAVINPVTGNIEYAVLSFGVLGMGNRLFAIPWSALSISPNRDYAILKFDSAMIERAPGFDPDHWPEMSDPVWRRSIDDYYTRPPRTVRERTAYVERPVVRQRHGMSLLAGIALICLVLGAAWMTFLLSTRGWDQLRQDLRTSFQGVAHAAKETSQDAALTAKVKAALALSKRIPSDKISVETQGDVVTLGGEVPSKEIRDLSELTTRDVPGVRDVQNHLFVVNPTP